MRVDYSRKFLKAASRLPAKIIALADAKENLFKTDPFHSSLETHKLHGKEKDVWAFSVNRKYRIKFVFLDGNALFLDIGPHDIYE
ncbi:MAG: type II toxin-antitoxin system mRNA interferase toxin, RelE/StbE family [Patescibacteria group bacterium]